MYMCSLTYNKLLQPNTCSAQQRKAAMHRQNSSLSFVILRAKCLAVLVWQTKINNIVSNKNIFESEYRIHLTNHCRIYMFKVH